MAPVDRLDIGLALLDGALALRAVIHFQLPRHHLHQHGDAVLVHIGRLARVDSHVVGLQLGRTRRVIEALANNGFATIQHRHFGRLNTFVFVMVRRCRHHAGTGHNGEGAN